MKKPVSPSEKATIIDADIETVGNYGLCGYRDPKNPAPPHYQLLVKRFSDEVPLPAFSGNWKKKLARHAEGLTIIHSDQCPYVIKTMNEIPAVAREEFGIEPTIVDLPNCQLAQDSPNPYGIFSIIWNGELVADHPVSATRFKNIMKKVRK